MDNMNEAVDVVNNIFKIEKNESNDCHYEWLIREVIKILDEKCRLEKERVTRK